MAKAKNGKGKGKAEDVGHKEGDEEYKGRPRHDPKNIKVGVYRGKPAFIAKWPKEDKGKEECEASDPGSEPEPAPAGVMGAGALPDDMPGDPRDDPGVDGDGNPLYYEAPGRRRAACGMAGRRRRSSSHGSSSSDSYCSTCDARSTCSSTS